jgi:hypothetical protein
MSECETDIVLWSEHQAALLRRIIAGELVNSAEIDWPNIAEEIESMGRSERRACESHRQRTRAHAEGRSVTLLVRCAALACEGTPPAQRGAGSIYTLNGARS